MGTAPHGRDHRRNDRDGAQYGRRIRTGDRALHRPVLSRLWRLRLPPGCLYRVRVWGDRRALLRRALDHRLPPGGVTMARRKTFLTPHQAARIAEYAASISIEPVNWTDHTGAGGRSWSVSIRIA